MYFEPLQENIENLKGRFNSFIVTAFDDSLTTEMQLRSFVKFIKENMKLTNEMVEYLNEFIEKYDENNWETLEQIMNQWLKDGVLSEYLHDYIQSTVKLANLETRLNGVSLGTLKENVYIQNIKDNKLNYQPTELYSVYEAIPIKDHSVVEFTINNSTEAVQRFVVHNKSGVPTQNFDDNLIQLYIDRKIITKKENSYVLDVEKLSVYMEVGFITFQYKNEDLDDVFIYLDNYYQLEDLHYLNSDDARDYNQLKNKPSLPSLAGKLDFSGVSKKLKYRTMTRINQQTKQPDYHKTMDFFVDFIQVSTDFVIKFKLPNITERQFMIMANSKGECFKNLDYNVIKNNEFEQWGHVKDGYLYIDIKELDFRYRGNDLTYLYITREMSDIENEIEIVGGFYVSNLGEVVKYSRNVVNDVYLSEKDTHYINMNSLLSMNGFDRLTHLIRTNENNVVENMIVNHYENDTTLTVNHYQNGFLVGSSPLNIKTLNNKAIGTKHLNILMIGDSLTYNNDVRNYFHDKLTKENITHTFVGTQGNDPIKHEAYPGFASAHLVNNATHNNFKNNFIDPETNKFNMSYYLKKHEIATPDVVTIMLGTNDVRMGTSLQGSINSFTYIIDNIKESTPNAKILLMYPPFFSEYENTNQYQKENRKQLEYLIFALRHFIDNREKENIFTYDGFLNIHYKHDFKNELQPLYDFDDSIKITVGVDGTHLAKTGYYKLAMSWYNLLLKAYSW